MRKSMTCKKNSLVRDTEKYKKKRKKKQNRKLRNENLNKSHEKLSGKNHQLNSPGRRKKTMQVLKTGLRNYYIQTVIKKKNP
jgi:glucan-binding YG repeat protein